MAPKMFAVLSREEVALEAKQKAGSANIFSTVASSFPTASTAACFRYKFGIGKLLKIQKPYIVATKTITLSAKQPREIFGVCSSGSH